MSCEHENKIFSGERFMLSIFSWPWICPDCLERGEQRAIRCPKDPDFEGYVKVMKKADPDHGKTLSRVLDRRQRHANVDSKEEEEECYG